ncbi:XRE family transcriptional regulator [Crossiella sp. SN42]|uniref:XRE family transcriptional regulator n=1 Tax=Crossiella sp. SN42 TaxID=2944808 RepID=UPI00207C977B|nr:XRE family transcriptional regulator [Crossiella sp. SN42]MCO1581233.1 XRE family transcriptional regulator [Crossiella sp. SN42]
MNENGKKNTNLRDAIRRAGFSVEDISARLVVDPKTVDRWIAGRKPRPSHRRDLATMLNVDQIHLWPDAGDKLGVQHVQSEVVSIFPTRSSVPPSVWIDLIGGVEDQMDVLAYSAILLVEQCDLLPVLKRKVRDGVRFRFLIGDPASDAVAQRAVEEGTTGGLEGRVQLMLRYLQEVVGLPGVEVRTHGTVLYNSIYRFDDQMLVNGHAYGSVAGQNPVIHLRRGSEGEMWGHYFRSFEAVWATGNDYMKRG